MNILLTKINSRYLWVSNGKTHNKFCNLYQKIKKNKKKKKRGEKVVGFSKIGFFLGGSTVNKIISFTFNGWD